MKRTTKSLIALLVLVAMCVSFCVPTFAEVTESGHEHTENVVTTTLKCPGKDVAHTKFNCDYDVDPDLSVEASCGRDGYTAGVCKTCGYTFPFDVVAKPNDHEYENNGDAVAPTCKYDVATDTYVLVDGYQPVKCSICGDETNVTITATEEVHVWGEPYFQGNNSNPCTPEGAVKVKKCETCGKVVELEKEQYDDHSWVLTGNDQKVVCMEDGWVEFKCEYCNELKKVVIESPYTEHAWGEVTAENTTKAPTHNETGLATVACTRCGETKEVVLETVNHTWTLVPAVAPNCTDPGNDEYYTCECGKLATKDSAGVYTIIDEAPVIDAEGHDKTSVTVPGNCTTYSVTTTTCSKCDFEEVVTGTEYVHSYADEPTSKVEPTCKTYGYFFYGCTICGDEDAVKSVRREKLAHNFDEENESRTNIVYESEGSCTEDRVYYYTCINVVNGTVCGELSEKNVEEAKDHTWVYNEVVANCVEGGYKEKWCSVCDASKTTTYEKYDVVGVNENNHKITATGELAYKVTTPATCTAPGVGLHYCTYCNVNYSDVIPALEHDIQIFSQTTSDCDAPGSITYYCTRESECGFERYTVEDAANGHDYTVEISRTPATCTTTEKIVYGCSKCDTTDYYTVGGEAADNHERGALVPVLPNCQGQKAGWNSTCEICGDVLFIEDTTTVYDRTNPAHHVVDGVDGGVKQEITHEDGVTNEWYIEGTCTTEGKYQYKCSYCDELYLVSANDGSGKGHDADKITKDPDSIKPAVTPTCTVEGFTEGYKCAFCDYTVEPESLGFAEHTKVEEEKVEATCTTPGTEAGWYCSVPGCGHREGYAVIEALGHSFTNYVANGDANCTEVGTKTAKCDRCDVTDTKAGDAVDPDKHSFTNYVSNNDATCLEDGTETAKCDRCDATDTKADVDSKLGHLWIDAEGNEDKVDVPPTCTTKGYVIYSCLRCDDEDRNEANDRQYIVSYDDALGHTYTTLKAVEATCVDEGLTEGEWCPVCGEVFKAQENLGLRDYHTNGGVKIVETCVPGNSDLTGKRCDDCGELIAKKHAGEYSNTVGATCTEDGYTVKGCTVCGELNITETIPDLGHSYTVQKTVEGREPGVGVTGLAYMHCERCDEADFENPITLPAIDGIEFIYEIVNANGGTVIANSNTITVTIKTNATAAAVYSIALNLKYDTTVLKFEGYEFKNVKFGDYLVGEVAAAEGDINTVCVTAWANNTSVLENAEALDGVETLAVLTFTVLNDAAGKEIVITPDASSNIYKVVEVTNEETGVVTKAPSKVEGESVKFGDAVKANVVKLGKLTAGSAEDLNAADVIELIQISKEVDAEGNKVYNASADIDKDRDVDLTDAGYIKQYIAGLITYEELCAIGTTEDVAA